MEEWADAILHKLLQYAEAHGIKWDSTTELEPDTPCVCLPEWREVLINMSIADIQQLPYQVAHEIEHILLGHHQPRYFTPYVTTGQEGDANRAAIRLLVSMYFEDYSNIDGVNVYQFLDAFAIPYVMEDFAWEAIDEYFG